MSVTFDQLTAEQRAVVEHKARTILVLGGAGVGKTTTALWAARREVTDHGTRPRAIPGRRVLFVTFSRTAVAQIRSRAGGVLAGIADSVEILTFHGLAYRLVCSFGRYVGHPGEPIIAGEARTKLRAGTDIEDGALVYDDLLPMALRIVGSQGPIGELIRSRWSLVICDEFQDTDDNQWRLLQLLGQDARLLLMADPNQMIYGYRDGVDEGRLDAARARDRSVEISLPPGSHRDPSQVIPVAAAEVRWRRFDSEPVRRAVAEGRLVVCTDVPDDDDDRASVIARHLGEQRTEGHVSFGVYAKTNQGAAELSAALTRAEVDHVPIGFGEAFGEALAAMVTMLEFAEGTRDWSDVIDGLAICVTATVRSTKPPQLAIALRTGRSLPRVLEERLEALQADLRDAGGDVDRLAHVVMEAWERLGFTSGRRAWARAGRNLVSLVARVRSGGPDQVVRRVGLAVAALRNESFVELDSGDSGTIQLMNFHQTKGREADVVILSHSSNDWYGHDDEPYEEPSRVLYVAVTRARHRAIVLLPPTPHPLVAPFAGLVRG